MRWVSSASFVHSAAQLAGTSIVVVLVVVVVVIVGSWRRRGDAEPIQILDDIRGNFWAISKPIEYRFVDRTRDDVEAAYLARSGTPERWPYDSQTLDALNNRRVRFHGSRRPLATTMTAFVRDVWKPRYLEALAHEPEAETFYTWCARD